MHLIVHGVVQGVCFRMYTVDEAKALALTGWVRNRSDGTVEILAEGDEASLKVLEEWAHHGPPYATVSKVEKQISEAEGGLGSFSIGW